MGTEKRDRQRQGRQARLEQARAAQQRSKRIRTARNFGIFAVLVVVALFALSQIGGDDEAELDTGADTSTTVGDDPTDDATDDPGAGALPEGATISGETPCPPADGSAERTTNFESLPPGCIDPAKTYTAVFETTQGVVRVELDTESTPVTTNSFVVLARYGYYDGTELFRTNTGIGIIQGGSPHTQDNADPGPGFEVPDEGGEFDFSNPQAPSGPFTYSAGDLVMARSAGPDSSGGQFFFGATEAVSGLDSQGTYLRFGQTVEGLDVLESILALHEDNGTSPGEGAPAETVTIETLTIEES